VLSQRAGTLLSPAIASAAIAAVAAAPSVNSSDVVVAAPDILPVAPSPQRSRSKSPDPDLREQIALLDNARSALAKGTGERTLDVLRQYQSKFPNGAFRPEATVLRIEALSQLGRHSEARTLADRFIAEHRGTPIADRVARVVSKTDAR
jgi:outer membrane protein assembly factor BamD (BamD/ComL family)